MFFFQRSFSSIQGFFSEPAALHGVEVESSTAMHVFFSQVHGRYV